MRIARLAVASLVVPTVAACSAPPATQAIASPQPLFDEDAQQAVWDQARVRLANTSDLSVRAFAAARTGIDAGELVVASRQQDALGLTHVRVQQQHRGIVVDGGDLIVHLRGDEAYAVGGSVIPDLDVDTRAVVGADDAREILAQELAANPFGMDALPGALDLGVPSLRVVRSPTGDRLVWRFDVLVDDVTAPAQVVAAIDAHTGDVLELANRLETARTPPTTVTKTAAIGTGTGLYVGSVSLGTAALSTGGYELRDLSRGGGLSQVVDMAGRQSGGSILTDADNLWGSGTTSSAQSAAVDAAYGETLTYNYFATVHGRTGIANDSKGATSRVHYGRNYNNAFWSDSCFCMTYGDGDGATFTPLTSIDVAAHEMTHGVTSRTAALAYSGQSGGLNESMSDIFGTAVEFYAQNANDVGDYLIGEKIMVRAPGFLRSMSNPRADGSSIDHASQYTSTMDVHYSSGLANHAFFLLSEGGTNRTSNVTVTGIGRDAAEKIFFRALTTYMTSTTNFAGARAATLSAATDLFGAGSAQANAVAAVWSACGVN